jgi:hypothetical protein
MSGKGSGTNVRSAELLELKAYPRCGRPTGKDPEQALGARSLASAPSLLVQVLVARASDPTISSFSSDFRPQSKNVSLLELLQLRLVFRLYIIPYVRQHSSGSWVNVPSKLRA